MFKVGVAKINNKTILRKEKNDTPITLYTCWKHTVIKLVMSHWIENLVVRECDIVLILV